MLETLAASCHLMLAHKLQFCQEITNLMMNKKELEFKLLEARSIELKLSLKLLLALTKKICMYKDLYVSSLEDFQFQEHLEISRLKEQNMEVTKMLLYASLRSRHSS